MTCLVEQLKIEMADLLPKGRAYRIGAHGRNIHYSISERLYLALEAYAAAEGITFTVAFHRLSDELHGGTG